MNPALQDWLCARIAQETGVAPDAIDVDTPLYRYGIDSRTLAFIVENAETEFAVAADIDKISPAEPIRVLMQALVPLPDAGSP